MNKILAILGGIGAGAAVMYFMDPERGRTRRAMIRDKATGLSNDIQGAVGAKSRDLSNRAHGLLHEAKSAFSGGRESDSRDFGNREGVGI